jgi:hypothetical protein
MRLMCRGSSLFQAPRPSDSAREPISTVRVTASLHAEPLLLPLEQEGYDSEIVDPILSSRLSTRIVSFPFMHVDLVLSTGEKPGTAWCPICTVSANSRAHVSPRQGLAFLCRIQRDLFMPALSELHSPESEGLGGFQASSGSSSQMLSLLPARPREH